VSRPSPDENRERRRAEIVRAALALLDGPDGGLDRLSLRRVAEALGMHAAGLYWYIANKQELVDLLAKAIVAEAFAGLEAPAAGESWQAWLEAMARRLRRVIVAHTDGARVVAGAYLFRAEAITPALELALEVLEAAGLSPAMAMLGTTTVIRYTIGIALDEQASPPHPPPPEVLRDALLPSHVGPIDPARFPRVAEMFLALFARLGDVDRNDLAELHFRRGLALILAGMAQPLPALPVLPARPEPPAPGRG
jgi:TetR/AcrR family tetracycline transcriptional repressor